VNPAAHLVTRRLAQHPIPEKEHGLGVIARLVEDAEIRDGLDGAFFAWR